MDDRDRMAIDELFQKIAEVERRSPPRDEEAEGYIRSKITRQPSAPYYMAQTIVVQEQALNEAQQRIDELERQAAEPAGGGFLGGLFGTGRAEQPGRYGSVPRIRGSYDQGEYRRGSGGFLAGAAQTAMGVAGGMLIGNMLADWLTPDAREHAAGDGGWFGGSHDDASSHDDTDTQVADAGDFGGGDFDSGDF
jgi:hypothetical protein